MNNVLSAFALPSSPAVLTRAESERLEKAFVCLPQRHREAVVKGSVANVEEIRLRISSGLSVSADGRENSLNQSVEPADIAFVLQKSADGCFYTAEETISRGFITADGGHRVGLCGRVSANGARICTVRDVSSVSVRIARQLKGVGERASACVSERGDLRSTLIISPPGVGKTTLLRDVVRALSERGIRVGVADERCELAAVKNGRPQFELGACTDVVDSCPKSDAVMMLLRNMSPQLLAMDEITDERDAAALACAANSGAAILATAHAGSAEELRLRPVYARLLTQRVFRQVILLSRCKSGRMCEVYELC